jgi:hypothetical protein
MNPIIHFHLLSSSRMCALYTFTPPYAFTAPKIPMQRKFLLFSNQYTYASDNEKCLLSPIRLQQTNIRITWYKYIIQVVLVLHDFALMQLANLHHFLNLHNNFRFNVIWHTLSTVMFIFCRRLTGSDITVTPTVMHVDWLHWWYNRTAHSVSSSTALAFLTNMSEKHTSASASAIHMKNQQKIIGIKKKLYVICWLGENAIMLDSLRVAYTQFVMLIGLKQVLSQELKCLFSKNPTKNYGCESLTYLQH